MVAIRGRKGGSTLVVVAIHALLGWPSTAKRAVPGMKRTEARRRRSPDKVRKGDAARAATAPASPPAPARPRPARAATLGLVRGAVPTRWSACCPNDAGALRRSATAWWTATGAHAAVSIKDAGDDPDATHGAHLTADVACIRGGGGVVIVLRAAVAWAWSPSPARPGGRRPGHQPCAAAQHHRQRARPAHPSSRPATVWR